MNPWILERNCSLLPGRPDVIVNHSRSERDAVTPAPADAVSIALVKLLRGIISRLSHVATDQVAQSCPPNWLNSCPRSTFVRGNGVINEAGCWDYLVGMTLVTLGPSTIPRYHRVGGPLRAP